MTMWRMVEMNNHISKLTKIIASVALLLTAVPAIAQQKDILKEVTERGVLRIATASDVPPYSFLSASGELQGFDVDVGKMIAADLGVKAEFSLVDGPGRITALQTGKADIVVQNFTANFKRSQSINFTDPYVVVGMVFFTLSKRSEIKTLDDLNKESMKIGFGRGGTQETLVPAAAPKASIVKFAGMADTMEALDSGRIDATAIDNIAAAGFYAANPGKYKELPGRYSREDIAIGLPKGDFQWWLLINSWVRDFNLSGKNDALYKKWFNNAERPKIFENY
jgi:ABC-type amino acid transport substrate-binding protein